MNENYLLRCKHVIYQCYKYSIISVCLPQFLNLALVPLYVRTTFTGCCGFVWATFLCFSLQSGDGTAGAALVWLFPSKRGDAESTKENADCEDKVVAVKDRRGASKSPHTWANRTSLCYGGRLNVNLAWRWSCPVFDSCCTITARVWGQGVTGVKLKLWHSLKCFGKRPAANGLYKKYIFQ